MAAPLMPKATAVWLIENTSLSFEQIADFCNMHILEVQGIADGEVVSGMQGLSPLIDGQLTKDDIEACEKDPSKRLKLKETSMPKRKQKGPKYTPLSKRQDKPDAIAWLTKNYPQMTDSQIIKLIGTTKNTIKAIRERTHWNTANIKPKDPVLLGLCKQGELNRVIDKLRIEEDKNKASDIDDTQQSNVS